MEGEEAANDFPNSPCVTLPRKGRHLKDRWGLVSFCLHDTIPLSSPWVAVAAHSHTLSLNWARIPCKGQLFTVSFQPKHLVASPEQEDNTWVIFDLPCFFPHQLLCSCVNIPWLFYLFFIIIIGAFIWVSCVSDLICIQGTGLPLFQELVWVRPG